MTPYSHFGTVREEGVGEPIVNVVVVPAGRDTYDDDGLHAYDNGIIGKNGGGGSGDVPPPTKTKMKTGIGNDIGDVCGGGGGMMRPIPVLPREAVHRFRCRCCRSR